MPNNGVISKYANIPSSFIVESVESTDLVIINTPLTGSRVEQKAVPVSALGGGGALPYYSAVYKLVYDGEDLTEPIYNDFPTDYDLTTILELMAPPLSLEGYRFRISDNNEALLFRSSYLISELYSYMNDGTYGPIVTTKAGGFIMVEHLPSDPIQGDGLFIEFRIYKNQI